jgi:hypothetical protein
VQGAPNRRPHASNLAGARAVVWSRLLIGATGTKARYVIWFGVPSPHGTKHRSGLGVYRRAGVVFFWAQRTIEKAAGICALRLARFENGLSMKSIPASAVGGGASGASVGRNVADRQRLAAVLDGGGEFDAVMMASLRPGGVSRASRATVPDGLAD